MKNYEEFKQYILSCYPFEACGVIVDDIFIPIENTNEDKLNNFSFPAKEAQKYYNTNFIVIHSHTAKSFTIDPRSPSHEDMIGQYNTNVPWGIVHCDGENVSDILWLENPTIEKPMLLDREYIPNVYDCFTLARDYYLLEYGIDFGIHPRPVDWESWNPHYILHTYTKVGFIDIKQENMQVGDVIIFRIGSLYANHIGIYIGEGKFIHHLYQRTSSKDTIKRWQKSIVKVLHYANKKII